MMLSRTRAIPVAALIMFGMIATIISLTTLSHIAHGDTGSAAAPAVEHVLVSAGPVVQAAPENNAIAIVGVVLGGLALVVSALHAFFAKLAPLTKTLWDDKARDFFAEILADAGVSGTSTVNVTNVTAPAAKPEPTRVPGPGVGPAATLAVLLLGCGLAVSQTGCSGTTGDRAGTLVNGVLDCESPQLVAAALAAGNLAQAAIISTISGSGHPDTTALKAALTGIKDAGLQCAVAATIAMLAKPAPKSSVMAAGLEVQGDELRAAFAQARAELGWPQMVVR